MLSKESFIKASCTVWGVYAVQMLATPKMLTESHFHDASTPLSASQLRTPDTQTRKQVDWLHRVLKLETAEAYKIVLPWIVATGLLYPWSAKLGLFSEASSDTAFQLTLFVILPAMGLLAGM
ncbi:hypothetical protein EMIHUDRAFT_216408 [Emiliania huxleyi CCMP1516]|uniref:Uncharacterized protein n=2 Tax=Emiliania huxleyi TaxID=2903 RepID=A0A0D3IEX0_EMIH1|nr:hypothetical protein EMIHUDRAFT_216408 [Emiliania huxleyi CCMP1516]EOD09805.1 hypothetical protein EMIHUDRAFT_216408 [Emiliania huxleyi CCMP1516]|eukprot:XP_005762234.1 hypothetical protein EMIHUDRAFT_216408 [Emiliania huxleyi CCMP1516]